jgi:hypothetical protein
VLIRYLHTLAPGVKRNDACQRRQRENESLV